MALFAALIALTSASPASQDPAAAEPAASTACCRPFLCTKHLELGTHLGVALFSDDFEADPSFAAGVMLRSPLSWLSIDVLGLDEARLGLFLDLTITSIDREVEPATGDTSGTLFLGTLGVDASLLRCDGLDLGVQAGLQYAHFGSVDELDSGVGALFGVSARLALTDDLDLSLNPQISLGEDGDHLILLQLGLVYKF